MSKVVIFGIGRGADVATRYFRADSPHEIVAYTVDDAYAARKEFMGRPVIPFSRVETEVPPAECRMFIPLGFQRMNALRAEKYAAAKEKGYSLESYVSSKIVAWERPAFGENCFILEGNVFDFDVTHVLPKNAPDIHSAVFEHAATLKILRLLLIGRDRRLLISGPA